MEEDALTSGTLRLQGIQKHWWTLSFDEKPAISLNLTVKTEQLFPHKFFQHITFPLQCTKTRI